jgi:shikimate kinase
MAAAAIGSSTATTIALITAAAKEVGQKVESTLASPFLASAARSSIAAARGVTVTMTT